MQNVTDNLMLIIAVVVFLICVIVGFFGDLRLKKQRKIEKIMNDNESKSENQTTGESEQMPNENVDNSLSNNYVVNDQNVYPTSPGVSNDNKGATISNQNLSSNMVNNDLYEASKEITPDIYPPENKLKNVPDAFDGNIQIEENINNMF